MARIRMGPSVRSSAAYRIAFAFAAAFAIGSAVLGLMIFWAMHLAFTHQLDAMIADEAQTLVAEYRSAGGTDLADEIAEREASRSPAQMLYAVFAPNGRRLVGSLDADRPVRGIHDIPFTNANGVQDTARALAIDLSPRERLVVAADREWIKRTDREVIIIFAVGFVGVCLLGLIGALLFGAYLRRRLHAIGGGAEAIIAGDIRGRMPVGKRNDEFDELAATLNRMLERIERLLDNLRQVSSDIAHDLRTPLSRLRNRLENGLAEVGAGGSARDIIDDSIARVDEVLTLFAAILRIAEVEGGETRRYFAPVDMSELVTDLAESYAPAIRDGGRSLTWSIEPGLTLNGDGDLIAQAGTNLIENAQRHTPPGSHISLTLGGSADFVRMMVCDDGPGVPEADRASIVERFKRLETSRNTAGHGLGLNLVSAIAKLHGGALTFGDCAPGLCASLEIPRAATVGPTA